MKLKLFVLIRHSFDVVIVTSYSYFRKSRFSYKYTLCSTNANANKRVIFFQIKCKDDDDVKQSTNQRNNDNTHIQNESISCSFFVIYLFIYYILLYLPSLIKHLTPRDLLPHLKRAQQYCCAHRLFRETERMRDRYIVSALRAHAHAHEEHTNTHLIIHV